MQRHELGTDAFGALVGSVAVVVLGDTSWVMLAAAPGFGTALRNVR
jgi:hypothetical protein